MTDIPPNRGFLPSYWLVSAIKVAEFTPRTTVDIYEAQAQDVARRIDYFAGMDDEEFAHHNARALSIGSSISWHVLKDTYTKEFRQLCNQ
jgi:hypothetical protein